MENKYPKTVVTDGDGAMTESIKQFFPNATHRFCVWHLNRNAYENVKKSQFLDGFKKNNALKFYTCSFWMVLKKSQFEEFGQRFGLSKHMRTSHFGKCISTR